MNWDWLLISISLIEQQWPVVVERLWPLVVENAEPLALIGAVLSITGLWWMLARAQQRLRALGGELGRMRMQLLGMERLQYEADRQAARDAARLTQLEGLRRRAAAAFGKPDHQLARAMVRAGADERALLECGLTHAESHLMRVLHAAPATGRSESERGMLSPVREH